VSSASVGVLLVLLGLGLAVVGLLVWAGAFGWFGRLPGDIRIERETVRIYVPLASMIVVSLVLSALFYLFRRLF
jgi:hypothetical protein